VSFGIREFEGIWVEKQILSFSDKIPHAETGRRKGFPLGELSILSLAKMSVSQWFSNFLFSRPRSVVCSRGEKYSHLPAKSVDVYWENWTRDSLNLRINQ